MSSKKSLFEFTRNPLSNRDLFNNVVIISVIATFIFTINAFLVLHDFSLGFMDLIAFIVFTTILYLSNVLDRYNLANRIYSVFLVIIINAVWFIGGGYDGFNGYIMMLLLTVLMVIREKSNQVNILFFVIINVILLFVLEFIYPDLPKVYEEPVNQISQGIVLVISLITLYYFLFTLKKNYQLQKQIAEMSNQELEARNDFIKEQNTELTRQGKLLEIQKEKLENQSIILSEKVEERTMELSKANEDLISKNVKLDQFTNILAHNLRGPVARIKGLSELLKLDSKNAQNEALVRVRESILDLDHVLTDLQTILDIQRGNRSGFELVDLEEELNKCLALLQPDIKEKKIKVIKQVDRDVKVRGYKAYCQSIFHNLISNSIKFSSTDRKPIINIRITPNSGRNLIRIEDNGIGIEMKYASDKIFKLYQRFNNNHPGKGVGLYLVKTQVEAMHGSISMKSKVNVGTTFEIDL